MMWNDTVRRCRWRSTFSCTDVAPSTIHHPGGCSPRCTGSYATFTLTPLFSMNITPACFHVSPSRGLSSYTMTRVVWWGCGGMRKWGCFLRFVPPSFPLAESFQIITTLTTCITLRCGTASVMLPLDGLWLNASKPEPSLETYVKYFRAHEFIVAKSSFGERPPSKFTSRLRVSNRVYTSPNGLAGVTLRGALLFLSPQHSNPPCRDRGNTIWN